MEDNTSTPKRRRLGVGRICSNRKKKHSNTKSNYTSVTPQTSPIIRNVTENCDSPQLPSNQVKYLCDSGNTSYSDILCSFDVLDSSFLKDSKTSSSSGCKHDKESSIHHTIARKNDDISEDMFKSKFEKSMFMTVTELVAKENIKENIPDEVNNDTKSTISNHVSQELVTYCKNNVPLEEINEQLLLINQEYERVPLNIKSPDIPKSTTDNIIDKSQSSIHEFEKYTETENAYEKSVEETFDVINQTISNFEESDMTIDPTELQNLFSSPGPNRKTQNTSQVVHNVKQDSFYGLPMITKALFKTYRNVEKFYEWQEECLNLEAIKNGRNLIYALPTSGGKTLVAEVLMLRQVLNKRKNVLFILPYVAIVQEKIWALSPFALQLGFLVEEYAGGKGNIPPTKRRKKNSIYVATIEKGLALIRSLIELKRLDELGLIVVDELHLIGERSRGGTLETLLSTVLFTKEPIQIVGMSATIGNLDEIAKFLKAEVYEREFRPVQLTEYVKLGDMLHRIQWRDGGAMDLVPDRELCFDYTPAATSLDPDLLGGLVSEVVPEGSCLVFCSTKRNCENVTALLCKMLRKTMSNHRVEERLSLQSTLRSEGSHHELVRAVRSGVGYHHAGLTSDERGLLETAFRSGVISVLCCTSTLAAGVNLPARRVLIRAPYVGSQFISLAGYRQMVGRAGRAGICDKGESIIICSLRDKPKLSAVLRGGLLPANSALLDHTGISGSSVTNTGGPLAGAVLGAVSLGLCTGASGLRQLLAGTLLAVPQDHRKVDIAALCEDTLKTLVETGALEVVGDAPPNPEDLEVESENFVYSTSELAVSNFGKAAVKGGMDVSVARQLVHDLEAVARGLVLMGALHLLYLVTPHDAAGIRPDYRHYYELYCELDAEGLQTANTLGITEVNAIRMMTGKPITSVPVSVLCRFYVALMLHDLWRQVPLPAVADKYSIGRGALQAIVSSACSFANGAARYCECEERLWPFAALLGGLATRLRTCAAPELQHLMDLPAVKKGRALQLMRAGYKRIEDIAKATPADLVTSVTHLSRTAATQLISAARLMLIEKVENLRAEAEEVMEELKM